MNVKVLINQAKGRYFRGFAAKDPLAKALDFDYPEPEDVPEWDHRGMCNTMFRRLNEEKYHRVGELTAEMIHEYHQRWPSLSIGDVILINDEKAYACASLGWPEVDLDELYVVDHEHCAFCGNPENEHCQIRFYHEHNAFACDRCTNDPMTSLWDQRRAEVEGYEAERKERRAHEREKNVKALKETVRARDGDMDSVDWGDMDADLHICAGCGNAVDDVDDNNLCVECA